MGRPREFDPEDAMERALQAFWTLGYEAASLRELLTATGLSRGSFYKAFSDKKTMFLKVLERYDEVQVEAGIRLLTDPREPDGWARIRAFFASVTDDLTRGNRRGCLLCSAAAGPAHYDPDIAAAVSQTLGRLRGALASALAATAAGDAMSEEQRQRRAEILLTQYVGLRVLLRSQAPEEALRNSVAEIGALHP